MAIPLTLGVKNFAAASMKDFCPRCYWIKLRMGFRTPFNVFPGVFSVFDGHTKRRIHRYIEENKKVPPWMSGVGEITGDLQTPATAAQFAMTDAATNIQVRGVPDAIFVKPDETLIIIDFKTASPQNDHLLDLYATQLNTYALIAPQIKGFGPVSEIKLVYTNPEIEPGRDDGEEKFPVYFWGSVKPLALDPNRVRACFDTVHAIANRDSAPRGREGCNDCRQVDELLALADLVRYDLCEARRAFRQM